MWDCPRSESQKPSKTQVLAQGSLGVLFKLLPKPHLVLCPAGYHLEHLGPKKLPITSVILGPVPYSW